MASQTYRDGRALGEAACPDTTDTPAAAPGSPGRLRRAVEATVAAATAPWRAAPTADAFAPEPIEPLEARRLLVTISGGDTALLVTDDGAGTQVSISGDVSATLIGAATDEFGEGVLTDLPATVRGPGGELRNLGGVGGQLGVAPVNEFSGDDVDGTNTGGFNDFAEDSVEFLRNIFAASGGFTRFNITDTVAPGDQINLASLAANEAGFLYSVFQYTVFGRVPGEDGNFEDVAVPFIFLGRVNPANGQVEIVRNIGDEVVNLLNEGPGLDPEQDDRDRTAEFGLVDRILAADFDPLTGDLYFAIEAQQFLFNPGGDPQEVTTPILYRIAAPAGGFTDRGRSASGTLERVEGTFGRTTVPRDVNLDGFAFDGDGNIKAFLTRFTGDGRGDDSVGQVRRGIVTIQRQDGDFDTDGGDGATFSALQPVLTPEASRFNGADFIQALTAIEVIPDQPEFVYAVQGTGDAARLLRIRLNQDNPNEIGGTDVFDPAEFVARTLDLGPLQSPDGPSDPRLSAGRIPGANIDGFTYSPNVRNLFLLQDTDPSNNNERGAFYGIDTNSDQLLLIDGRFRPEVASIYAVLIDGDDPQAQLAVRSDADQRTLRVAGTGGQPFQLTLPGGVLVGATNGLGEPVSTLPLEQFFVNNGALPTDFGLPDNLPPGVRATGDFGRVDIEGTVTGQVAMGGSLDVFYANQILTGTAGGVLSDGVSQTPSNFAVSGDLRALLSFNSVGGLTDDSLTFPVYRSGFDFDVGGRLGAITSLAGSFLGTGVARGGDLAPLTIDHVEIEEDIFFARNDSFGTPEMLGTGPVGSLGFERGAVRVQGSLESVFLDEDGGLSFDVDYYGLPLLAGQTFEFGLDSGEAALALFDPDGRIVATNISDQSRDDNVNAGFDNPGFAPFGDVTNDRIRYTAQMPGVYRVAVGGEVVSQFLGFEEPDTAVFNQLTRPGNPSETVGGIFSSFEGVPAYTLTIRKADDLTLGAIAAQSGSVIIDSGFRGLEVRDGDLGALFANTGDVLAVARLDDGTAAGSASVIVPEGNIRALQGRNVGSDFDIFGSGTPGLNLFAPGGTVGHVRALGDNTRPTPNDGDVNLNFYALEGAPGQAFNPERAVNNYQLVDANGDISGAFVANAEIGVVRGRSIVGNEVFAANADNLGQDGVIHLVDSATSIGNAATGGPIFSTGTGGNVRYVRANGFIFNDPLFGGGFPDEVNLGFGEEMQVRDDSGTLVTLRPLDADFIAGNTSVDFEGTAATIRTLQVRGAAPFGGGGGGEVITSISTFGSMEVDAEDNASSTAEIAELQVFDPSGQNVEFFQPPAGTFDPFVSPIGRVDSPPPQNIPVDALDPTESNLVLGRPLVLDQFQSTADVLQRSLTLEFNGTNVDVLQIAGGEFSSILNNTNGEITTALATSIGVIEAANLGFGRPVAGGQKLDPLANYFPQRAGVFPPAALDGHHRRRGPAGAGPPGPGQHRRHHRRRRPHLRQHQRHLDPVHRPQRRPGHRHHRPGRG